MKKLFLNSIWMLALVAVCFTACEEEVIIVDELQGFAPLMEETSSGFEETNLEQQEKELTMLKSVMSCEWSQIVSPPIMKCNCSMAENLMTTVGHNPKWAGNELGDVNFDGNISWNDIRVLLAILDDFDIDGDGDVDRDDASNNPLLNSTPSIDYNGDGAIDWRDINAGMEIAYFLANLSGGGINSVLNCYDIACLYKHMSPSGCI